jgi:hypothetical protein
MIASIAQALDVQISVRTLNYSMGSPRAGTATALLCFLRKVVENSTRTVGFVLVISK